MKFHTLIALFFLAACTVGPNYRKPDMPLPENWISSDKAEGEVQQDWWKNFDDPVLDQLIAKADAGNFDLKISENRIAEARSSLAIADAAYLPSGDLHVSGNREANRIAFPGGNASGFADLLKKPFNTFEVGFDASWEPDLFGGKQRAAEAASADVEAAVADRDAARVSLLAEVARTYMDIREYQALLAVTQQIIDSTKSTLDIAKQRFDAGESPGLDVTQAAAQMQQAETQLPYYRNLLAGSEYAMDVLIGEKPGSTHDLIGGPAPIPVTDKQLVLAAPAKVIADRPDIRAAERELAAATAQEGVAVAKFFPDISLSGFLGLLNTQAGDLLAAGSKSWMLGGNIMLPILNYGTLSANLDTAKTEEKEALASYQKTVIGALSDVERSVTAYTEHEKFRTSLAANVTSNKKAADVAQKRYTEGLTSFLEVLDAQRTLYAAQLQLAEADAQNGENLIAVYKSLGGGWKASENRP